MFLFISYTTSSLHFLLLIFFFFQIAKAKAESRIECLRNGDGNGTYIMVYCLGYFNREIVDSYIFIIKMNARLN